LQQEQFFSKLAVDAALVFSSRSFPPCFKLYSPHGEPLSIAENSEFVNPYRGSSDLHFSKQKTAQPSDFLSTKP
jgi:hypothetical protein